MNIHEMINLIPADRVGFQVLAGSIEQAQKRKSGATAITFQTDAVTTGEVAMGKGRRGLVLWFTEDDWQTILDAVQARKAPNA